MDSFSESVKAKLRSYYQEAGILPNERCKCAHLDKCAGDFARGMQCHVGSKYGEKLRILVASMDCGYGGADVLEERIRKVVEKAQNGDLDKHMQGTYQALELFYGEEDPKQLVNYMAMTNTCKCCEKNTSRHMPWRFYWNCREHSLAEIIRIAPEVILFQGKFAPTGCSEYFSAIEGIADPEIKACLKYMDYQDLHCYAILCIHPSAYGRVMKKKLHFYNEVLPKIAEYVMSHPL